MFKDREEAGLLLADLLKNYIDNPENTIILAIPRGGVPVAYKIAEKLGIPFGMIIAKKITPPDNPEAAIGAATPDGTYILSPYAYGYPYIEEAIQKAINEARKKLEKYADGKEPDVEGKIVIIVDDGIATGYTAMAAGKSVKERGAQKVILAVPVCPVDSISRAREIFDEVICYHKVDTPFFAVGAYYQDFHQVQDYELFEYLQKAKEKNLLVQ
ncbi:phosphoribosyltransferase family protein [Persephonella sp.]|uniref:phosphoribosyltransferase n=1 Tax=Persephonella sp. TaxID=2060922 RepID=UPI002614392E|nr:phosphoribosyltransferase family protein [Persephonella sp.]